ncbi:MAG: PLP-dependent transferase [Prevotella sp.]
MIHRITRNKRNLNRLPRITHGFAPDLIRLSVGIEDVEDILDDIKQALDKI